MTNSHFPPGGKLGFSKLLQEATDPRKKPFYERDLWEKLVAKPKIYCVLCDELLHGKSYLHKYHKTLPGFVRACIPCWVNMDASDVKHPLYIERPKPKELPEEFMPKGRGRSSGRGRLTAREVNEIRRLKRQYGSSLTNVELARRFNINEVTAHNIVNYKSYVPDGET